MNTNVKITVTLDCSAEYAERFLRLLREAAPSQPQPLAAPEAAAPEAAAPDAKQIGMQLALRAGLRQEAEAEAEAADERKAEVKDIVAERKQRKAKAKAEPQPEPAPAPAPQPEPAPAPAPAPAPQPEPQPDGITIDTLKRALMDRVKAYGYDSAVSVLRAHGAARLQDVPPAKWVSLMAALMEGM